MTVQLKAEPSDVQAIPAVLCRAEKLFFYIPAETDISHCKVGYIDPEKQGDALQKEGAG